MGPNGCCTVTVNLSVSTCSLYQQVCQGGKAHFTSTAGDSKADHPPPVYQPSKTGYVFVSSAISTPAEPNPFESNDSCKINLQRAQENPDINKKEFPFGGISQDDK